MNDLKTKQYYIQALEAILLWHFQNIKKIESRQIIDVLLGAIGQIQSQLMILKVKNVELSVFLQSFIYENDRLDVFIERDRLVEEIKSGKFDEFLGSYSFIELE